MKLAKITAPKLYETNKNKIKVTEFPRNHDGNSSTRNERTEHVVKSFHEALGLVGQVPCVSGGRPNLSNGIHNRCERGTA
jgi:hypothetical protein